MSTFPSSPSFTSVNFKINTPLIKTTTNSGKITRVAMGHSFYTFTVKFPPMTPVEYGAINGFLASQLGGYSAFQIVLPKISYTKATQTAVSAPTTTTSTNAGSFSVTVNGVGSGRTVLKSGDYFKFSNHSKVYMATADLTGDTTINFSGALVTDVPAGTSVTVNAVPFTVILDENAQEYDSGLGGMVTMNLDMREVW